MVRSKAKFCISCFRKLDRDRIGNYCANCGIEKYQESLPPKRSKQTKNK